MKRPVIVSILALPLALALAACAPNSGTTALPGTSGSPSASPGSPSALPGTSGSPSVPPGATQQPDPCAAPNSQGLLREIRTAAHAEHDRVVFEFCGQGAPAVRLRYVDAVTEDPSDRPVALTGQAFVRVVFDGGTLDTGRVVSDPSTAQRYTGPTRLTPGHPLLKELALAGDYEGVLSFGLGLARPAGVTVNKLSNPARVAVDLWYAPPHQFVYPARSLEQARELQDAVQHGHQPWLTSPVMVIESYIAAELTWTDSSVRRVGGDVYEIHSTTDNKTAIVTVFQPFPSTPSGIWIIGSVALG